MPRLHSQQNGGADSGCVVLVHAFLIFDFCFERALFGFFFLVFFFFGARKFGNREEQKKKVPKFSIAMGMLASLIDSTKPASLRNKYKEAGENSAQGDRRPKSQRLGDPR
jgi:hypothetical protein